MLSVGDGLQGHLGAKLDLPRRFNHRVNTLGPTEQHGIVSYRVLTLSNSLFQLGNRFHRLHRHNTCLTVGTLSFRDGAI